MPTKTKTKKKTQVLPITIGDWEKPIPFTEDFKWKILGYYSKTTFTADSYTAWMEDALPIIKGIKSMTIEKAKTEGIKIGEKIFYLRSLPLWHMASQWGNLGFGFADGKLRPVRCSLSVYKARTAREICFDAVVNIPVLAEMEKYGNDLKPWMSLTPNEMFTLRGQIRRGKKNTAIAGLGLGWSARKVLERKQVTHVTIYEKDQDLIDYFGKSLVEDFGDRVTIVCCDAYEAPWMDHDVALWDIWQEVGDAAWDRKYMAIREEMRAADKVCVGWTEGARTD